MGLEPQDLCYLYDVISLLNCESHWDWKLGNQMGSMFQ